MDTTVSPQIKRIALAGLLGAVALAGAMFFFSRSGADASPAAPLPPPAVVKPKPAAQAKPKPAAQAKPKPKPAAQAKEKAKPSRSLVAPNGLPTAIAAQLARHEIVVASIFTGGAAVDRLALDEARAGAADARVGFAAMDVSNRQIAKALAEKTNVLAAPALLVFARDGEVKARLNGFADRLVVAEIAASAG